MNSFEINHRVPHNVNTRTQCLTHFSSNETGLEQRIYQYFEEINKVPVPYHWSYKLDDIDLEKEDLDRIAYKVVNHKATAPDSKELRAPEPIKRGRKKEE